MENRSDVRVTKFEAIGALVCGAAAVLMHGLYQWTGGAIWAGLISAANESLWEHGKVLMVPYLLWAFMEFLVLKQPVKKFTVAKTAGLIVMLAGMIAFYYLYTGIIGRSVPVVDLLCIFIWMAVGQIVSRKLLSSYRRVESWFTLCVFLLILLAVMFISFTVNPPHIPLFQDPVTGRYGFLSSPA